MFRRKKNLFSLPGVEPQFVSYLVCSLITILALLSLLLVLLNGHKCPIIAKVKNCIDSTCIRLLVELAKQTFIWA
jgi:hypothetical protein